MKAGNSKGTSTLADSIKFTMGEKSLYITPAASQSQEGGHVGVAIAVVLALVVVAAVVGATVWFLRNKKMLGLKGNGGIAFENPSYLREVNMDNVQVSFTVIKVKNYSIFLLGIFYVISKNISFCHFSN